MTIVLAIIGGIVIIIGAASRVPPAAAAFLRACIPLISAYHELSDALHPPAICQRRSDQLPGEGGRHLPGWSINHD